MPFWEQKMLGCSYGNVPKIKLTMQDRQNMLCAGAYINGVLCALFRTLVCRDTVMLFQVLEGNILDVQHDADLTGD